VYGIAHFELFIAIRLSFRDQVEQIEELREADGGGFRALDERVALGAQRGDAEGHGDAVVAA
jgi:hypothetical protein